MQKSYIIGGLAVVGAIALFAWYFAPKNNKDVFLNAGGCGCGA